MEELRWFTTSNLPSDSLIDLLSETTLGTNGAKYQHLDTSWRIHEMDNPLYLCLKRNSKTIANVTFCKREQNWYIRYFAFKNSFQSNKGNEKKAQSSYLKDELKKFFNSRLQSNKIKRFYAYIDNENERSLNMSQTFGFKTIASVKTQTFSRVYPKKRADIVLVKDKAEISKLVDGKFKDHLFYSNHHILNSTGNFYGIKKGNEVIAFAKFYTANWRIHALPGKNGARLVKVLPYLPLVNKLIKPKKHSFLVPEAVWVKNNDTNLLSDFFETVLAEEKKRVILWWIHAENNLLKLASKSLNWGLLDRFTKPNEVSLITLDLLKDADYQTSNIYTLGIDFI